jgi:hypothetical protein
VTLFEANELGSDVVEVGASVRDAQSSDDAEEPTEKPFDHAVTSSA